MSVDQPARGPCVVWGGYGYGNTGDDLVLAVAIADLRQQLGENIQVLSPAPEQTRSYLRDTAVILHPSGRPRRAREKWLWKLAEGAESSGMISLADRLHRWVLQHPDRISSEPGWLKLLANASSLHLTGGGYLTDRFHLRHFLRPLRLARSRRLPITTSPLGLGPFRHPKNAVTVASLLRGSRLAVRDEDSLRYCEAHGLSAVEKPDDGFRWRQVADLPVAANATNTIGVCIFSQHSPRWSADVETWWVRCLQALGQSLPGCPFEGFCFHTGREMDYETTRRLFTRAGFDPNNVQPPQTEYRLAIMNLARYRAILTSRFHAAVTASEMGLPCVAIALDDYYEAKMRSALKHAPAPLSVVNPTQASPQSVAQWLSARLGSASSKPTTDLRTSSG